MYSPLKKLVSLVGPRPLDGRGTFMWTCTWSRCYAVAVGWDMHSRSCELAHEVDATLWLSVGACIHVHVNLPGVKCGSSSEQFHFRSQVVFQASPTLPVPRRWTGPGSRWKISCQLTCFWSAESVGIPLCTHPCDNMCSCGAVDQPWRIQILKGSWKNLKRCCEHKTAKKVWKPSSCGPRRIDKNAGFV